MKRVVVVGKLDIERGEDSANTITTSLLASFVGQGYEHVIKMKYIQNRIGYEYEIY